MKLEAALFLALVASDAFTESGAPHTSDRVEVPEPQTVPPIEPTPAESASPSQPPARPAPPDISACCVLEAGTPVELEIAEALSSKQLKRGDTFALRLSSPLVVDGHTVVPAGTEAMGEVIHAERSRGGGKPGELLLAARHLRYGPTQIRLRGLKFGGAGQDRTGNALAASMVLGPFAHFIKGREIEVPAGTIVTAKIADRLPLPAITPPQSSMPPATPAGTPIATD